MSVQWIDLAKIAGITVLVTLLWAGSIALTYWDLHRRQLSGAMFAGWLALVGLIPLAGFVVYLVYRIISRFLDGGLSKQAQAGNRRTATKPRRGGHVPSSTLVAADLPAEGIFEREFPAPARPAQTGLPPACVLTIASGVDQGTQFYLNQLPAVIGRGAEAVVRLDGDLGVSRRHAELYEHAGALRIRDLRSTHGTLVNGIRVDDRPLAHGDRVQVGVTVLAVQTVPSSWQ